MSVNQNNRSPLPLCAFMLYDEGSDDDGDDDDSDDCVGDYDDGDDEVDVYDNDEVSRSECAICDLKTKV